jgi:hypothetical protein
MSISGSCEAIEFRSWSWFECQYTEWKLWSRGTFETDKTGEFILILQNHMTVFKCTHELQGEV